MKKSLLILLALMFSLTACASGTSIGNGLVAKESVKKISDKDRAEAKKLCEEKKGTLTTVDGEEVCETKDKKIKLNDLIKK
jgi:hypothetical protein